MDAARWNSVLAVNLQAQLDITQALLDADGVLKPGARVVSVSSQSGIAGNRGQTNYGASKAGVIGIVETLAPVLAERGQTINAVAPGFIETEMVLGIPEKVREKLLSQIPLKRFGTAEEVGRAVVYIVSSDGAYITGAELSINGGLLM